MPKARGARTSDLAHGRAVPYLRVSALKGREGDAFHSPELQIAVIRRNVIGPERLREIVVIQDIDVTGRTFAREGLDRIRAMAEAREIDVVVVYDYSRLGRNLSEAAEFIKWLAARGVRVISANERADNSPEGTFMVNQFLNMAQLMSDQIGRKWSEVINRRAVDQGLPHAHAPLGYRKAGKGIEPDPDTQQAVKDLFTGYAAGDTVGVLVRRLTGTVGRPVGRDRVKRLLANAVYHGQVQAHGDWYPGRHEPLIDDDTWRKVQDRLARDAVTPGRILAPKYAMTGLLWCAHCGRRLTIWPSKPHGGPLVVPRARCRHVYEIGISDICAGVGTPRVDAIEAITLDRVQVHMAKLRDDPAARSAKVAGAATAEASLARARQALADTRAAMGRLLEEWARQELPEDAYRLAMARLTESEKTQAEAVARLEAVKPAERDPDAFVRLAAEMLRLWPDLLDGERNQVMRDVVDRVTVRRELHRGEPLEVRVVVDFR